MSREDFTRVRPQVSFYTAGDGFERAVVFEPGYLDPGPRGPQWCGKHGMAVRFLLRGPKGVTQFLFNAGWVPGEKGVSPQLADHYPAGYDLGYHAVGPQYDGHEDWSPAQGCEYMDGGRCYYDGSGLAADDVLTRFIAEGDVAIWQVLRERYDELKDAS